jgi:CRISPR-associated protein Cas1
MPTLYVTEPGARVEKEHGRLLVTKEDIALASVPLAHVTEVVLTGAVGVTTPAMLALLDAGCGLSLITTQGRLRGRLRAAEAGNVPLRQQQYRRIGDERFALEVSRAIVAGKLRNSRTLARRMQRGGPLKIEVEMVETMPEPQPGVAGPATPEAATPESHGAETGAAGRITAALKQTAGAAGLAELRGLEGSASKAYFSVLRAALRPELTFEKRTRRPPRDPANALLSLAYSLLTNALFTAVEVAGLDPYAGFFHAEKHGRPALALDLMEEFRPVIADSVVLTVVNKGMLGPDDFETGEDGGVYLARAGLRKFLAQFARRLGAEVFHPAAGRALSYQKVLEVQARRLRKCIESGEPDYEPFLVK